LDGALTIHGIAEVDMSTDQQGGALKPVKPARVAEELRKLSSQRKEGKLSADEYEHRFARMISELRERRIDGNRAEILGALTPLKDQGIVTAADWTRLTKQLGLA
jgi:chorismate mutase